MSFKTKQYQISISILILSSLLQLIKASPPITRKNFFLDDQNSVFSSSPATQDSLTHTTLLSPPCIYKFNSFTSARGEILSPNYPNPYPNNLNCRYEFYGRQNERVLIQVVDFNLESPQTTFQDLNLIDYIQTNTSKDQLSQKAAMSTTSPLHRSKRNQTNNTEEKLNDMHQTLSTTRQCFYDYLDVFTADAHGRLYWRSRHCGTQIDQQIVSNSPTLVLIFKTDRIMSYRGFRLRYHFSFINILPFVTASECGSSEIVGNGSQLSSPNYPKYFPYHIECAWTITVEEHQNILVKFVDVNLNQPCHISQISIWDGYVNNVRTPDLVVCEKLLYYHQGLLSYKSKSNRLVIKLVVNKVSETNDELNPKSTKTKAKFENLYNKTVGQSNTNYGFLLSWTGIHLADNCGPGTFQCKGGEYCIDSKKVLCQTTFKYCISNRLVCDGVSNCDLGDESDERFCNLKFLTMPHQLFLIIGCAGILFIFLMIAITFVLYKYNKKRIKSKHDCNKYINQHKTKQKDSDEKISADQPSILENKLNQLNEKNLTKNNNLQIASRSRNDTKFYQIPNLVTNKISNENSPTISSYETSQRLVALPSIPVLSFDSSNSSNITNKAERIKRNSSFSKALLVRI